MAFCDATLPIVHMMKNSGFLQWNIYQHQAFYIDNEYKIK